MQTAHFWAREISALGHEVRLVPPAYVKPFVKRQKNDAADAEAIVEAASRPTMRFQHMRLGWHALGQRQFHGGQRGLFIVVKHKGEDIDHLPISTGFAEHVIL